MRYANIKKASKDEQQNKTTNIYYIKKFVPLKNHLLTKSTYRQITLKLNKITYLSPEKIWDQSIKRFGN